MSEAPFGRLGEWLQIAVADVADDSCSAIWASFLAASGTRPSSASRGPRGQGKGLAEEAARTLIDGSRRPHCGSAARRDHRHPERPSARLLRRLEVELEAEMPAEFRGQPCREWHFSLGL